MAKKPSKPKPSGGISFVEAFDDPNLFGPYFKGPSWNGWRAVLKAAHGVALNDDELRFFRTVAEPRSAEAACPRVMGHSGP